MRDGVATKRHDTGHGAQGTDRESGTGGAGREASYAERVN